MFIKTDRRFLSKLARFFLLYFLIYMIVSWFWRDENEPFLSFSNFSHMVEMGSFMGIIFAVFDREQKNGTAPGSDLSASLKLILFGVVVFLLITIPLLVILYFLFTWVKNEEIDLLVELAKLGVFAILAAVLFGTLIWFRATLKRRKNSDLTD